jgi:hypothetical protein
MATYKLIQDIEAEDHILGPLTLRQFIYGMIAAFFYYVCFILITKHVEVLLVLFLPLALLATFFAFPFKRDQPTEVWALARLQFMLKPRRRIWSQSGVKELVTITAPKKLEHNLTNGLSETEVKSRLQALALTLDTRGWAIKNLEATPEEAQIYTPDSDRLIGLGTIPSPVPDYNVTPEEDILDDQNPQSVHIADIISRTSTANRQDLVSLLNSLDNSSDGQSYTNKTKEKALSEVLKHNISASNLARSNLHTIATHSAAQHKVNSKPKTDQTPPIDHAKLNFALNNPGLSIQTLAKEARTTNDNNEVVINLHH